MSVVDAPVEQEVPELEEIQARSLKQIAWARLKRDRAGMISLYVIIAVTLVAIFAPLITRALGVDPFTFDSSALSDELGGLPASWSADGTWWAKAGMSWNHLLGVEPGTGRDILARLLYGARVSLFIATTSTLIIVIIGTVVGIVSGYSRGFADQALGRLMDLVLAFPLILIALVMSQPLTDRISQTFGLGVQASRITYLILIFSLFGWPYLARIVRGQVLSLREREFVESAVSLGSGTPRILFKEILPNLWAPILVVATITLPGIIAGEAGLAFLGVGVLPPTPTWGAMLGDSTRYFKTIPTLLFIPGMALFIVVLAFNLFGDAIRDALDPKAGRV
jgi:peptide/nickel transport system permease protein